MSPSRKNPGGEFSPEEKATIPLESDFATSLTDAERAALSLDVSWLEWRADFRNKVVGSGIIDRAWRSVFEADMILSLVAHAWLSGRPITLKELATYFAAFATETTVLRHLDDMEAGGILRRVADDNDRRRLLLIPTERMEHIGKAFLGARVELLKRCGFVFVGETEEK